MEGRTAAQMDLFSGGMIQLTKIDVSKERLQPELELQYDCNHSAFCPPLLSSLSFTFPPSFLSPLPPFLSPYFIYLSSLISLPPASLPLYFAFPPSSLSPCLPSSLPLALSLGRIDRLCLLNPSLPLSLSNGCSIGYGGWEFH